MKILVVVDMQNDFITGVLGSTEAQKIVQPVADYIKNSDADIIYLTADEHSLRPALPTIEEQNVTPHCIINTKGIEIEPSILEAANRFHNANIIYKDTFSSNDLKDHIRQDIINLTTYNSDYKFNWDDISIELIGLCTECCVLSNAIMLRNNFPNAHILVKKDLCAGSTPKVHEEALNVMRYNSIEVI